MEGGEKDYDLPEIEDSEIDFFEDSYIAQPQSVVQENKPKHDAELQKRCHEITKEM